MSLKRLISSLDLAADARAARARRSAQPSNKEGLEDPTLETPLKDTGLPPSPPAPPIDGRTLFNLETLLIATKMKAEAEAQEAQNVTTMKTEAEVSPEGLATLAQLLADETTADKTTTADDSGDGSGTRTGPMTNSWGPVIIEGWPGVPETTEEGYTSSSSLPDSEATLVLPTHEDRAASEDPLIRMTPWPCARCNREPIDTVWRPLDGATAFDTEERICGACWLAEEVESSSQPDSEVTTEEGYTSSSSQPDSEATTEEGCTSTSSQPDSDGAQPDSEGDARWVAMLE